MSLEEYLEATFDSFTKYLCNLCTSLLIVFKDLGFLYWIDNGKAFNGTEHIRELCKKQS